MVSLMRGNWIFIAFDDCHFPNKTQKKKRKEKTENSGIFWDFFFGCLTLIKKEREFHYLFFYVLFCSFTHSSLSTKIESTFKKKTKKKHQMKCSVSLSIPVTAQRTIKYQFCVRKTPRNE